MRIVHRGLAIELADDDARIAGIENVLFGKSLDAGDVVDSSAPAAPLPLVPPADEPKQPPHFAVPAPWRAFWSSLGRTERRELMLLGEEDRRPADLERLLGLSYGGLKGRHAEIHRCARKHGIRCWIFARGRGRDARFFYLEEKVLPVIRELSRRQAVVDAE